MNEVHGEVIAVFVIVAGAYTAGMFVLFRYAAGRTPAGIVRRLFRTGQPVSIAVSVYHPLAWDPSRHLGSVGFPGWGVATYNLVDGRTVRVRFQPRTGPAIERSGPIPDLLLPDTAETRRRKRIARAVITLYLAVGLATFFLTSLAVHGSASLRARIAALCALGSLAIAWLVTHYVLSRARDRHSARAHRRHLAAWVVAYVAVSAAFGVFWHLDTLGDPQPIPWASAFVDAGVFVLVSGAVLAATLHHHSYIHHSEDRR